jgi:hypothetical protein
MSLLLLLTVLVLFGTAWLALFLSDSLHGPARPWPRASGNPPGAWITAWKCMPPTKSATWFNPSIEWPNWRPVAIRSMPQPGSQGAANTALEQRRRHRDDSGSIPTGVLSLDADKRITHVNQALLRMIHPAPPTTQSADD